MRDVTGLLFRLSGCDWNLEMSHLYMYFQNFDRGDDVISARNKNIQKTQKNYIHFCKIAIEFIPDVDRSIELETFLLLLLLSLSRREKAKGPFRRPFLACSTSAKREKSRMKSRKGANPQSLSPEKSHPRSPRERKREKERERERK